MGALGLSRSGQASQSGGGGSPETSTLPSGMSRRSLQVMGPLHGLGHRATLRSSTRPSTNRSRFSSLLSKLLTSSLVSFLSFVAHGLLGEVLYRCMVYRRQAPLVNEYVRVVEFGQVHECALGLFGLEPL